jgi:hypothetical protein
VFLNPRTLIRLGVPPLRLELLTSISGVTFDECFARRETVLWDNVPVDIISRADLQTNKQAAGRLKDLGDLEQLAGP